LLLLLPRAGVLVASEEFQLIHVHGDLSERELNVEALLCRAEPHQAEAFKVAGEDVTGLFGRRDRAAEQVVARLIHRDLEINTWLLRLADHHARPEQVNIAGLAGARAARVLLE